MIYIECPEEKPTSSLEKKLFLAGGITNCSNWQLEIIKLLENENIIVFNPRRDNFDITDPKASDFQIEWEFNHLKTADIILFWFCPETLCPIVLFELGTHSERARRGEVQIFVGCHPEYKRKYDVVKQMQLLLPELTVVESLEELANLVKREI